MWLIYYLKMILPPPDPDAEPALDPQRRTQLVPRRRVHARRRLHHLHREPPDHGGRHGLHLHVRHLLPEGRPRPRMEHRVPRRVGHHELAAITAEPPLGSELAAVVPPQPRHPPHRVRGVVREPAGPHRRAVRQHVRGRGHARVDRHRRVQPHRLRERRVQVVHPLQPLVFPGVVSVRRARDLLVHAPLAARVGGEEPEEPGEGGGRAVLPGQHEAHHHVPQEPPLRIRRAEQLAELSAGSGGGFCVQRRREPRQEVLLVLAVLGRGRRLLCLQHPHHILVDDPDGLAHPPLAPDVGQPHRPPQQGRRVEYPREGDLDGVVERREERLVPPAAAIPCLELEQSGALDAEGHAADVVEGEAPEHVLQVQGHAGARGGVEEREEAAVEVLPEHPPGEAAERAGREGVGGDLALEAPEAAVGEEDAAAEEVGEGDREARALDVVGEVGAQEVVDGLRSGGGDAAAEAERAADLDGGGRGLRELVRGPVEEAVQVAEERHGVAEDPVRVRTVVRARRGRWDTAPPEVDGEEDREQQQQQRDAPVVHDLHD
ncbi:hypothetical protein VPH35_055999 [Triticum aestivum]